MWTELPASLRPFIETVIHPLLILRHVIGPRPPVWKSIELGRYGPRADFVRKEYKREIAPTFLDASGEVTGVSGAATAIRLLVGKYIPDATARRGAAVRYAHGQVKADFDHRRLDIETP